MSALSDMQQQKEATYDSVKLGQNHTIDTSRFTLRAGTSSGSRGRKVTKRPVEFGQLVDRFVAYEGFTNKDDLVRSIDSDEL